MKTKVTQSCKSATNQDLLSFIFQIHADVPHVLFQPNGLLLPAGPANPKSNRLFSATEHLGCPVLRPVPRARLTAPTRTLATASVKHTHLRAHRIRISGGPIKHDAQPAPGALIQIQFGGRVVLGNSQVHATVVVKVGQSRASLFPVDFDASDACVGRDKSPVALAAQPQAAPAIIARKVRHGPKEVLAEEQVFDSIAIEIADVDGKDWGQLCLARQRYPFKMRTSIKKYAGLEFCRLDDFRCLISSAEDVLDSRLAKGLVGRELACQFWHRASKREAITHRKPIGLPLPGFNQLDFSVGIPVTVEHAQFGWAIKLINCVASPVANCQIHSAIAIKITGGDACPPSSPGRESPLRCH